MKTIERTAHQEYDIALQKISPNKQKKTARFFVFSFLVLPIINFIIFYLYVNIDSFIMAFQTKAFNPVTYELEEVFTLDNFKQIKTMLSTQTSTNLLIPLRNTIIFYLVGNLVTLPLTILTCYFLTKKIRGYKFFRAIFYLPCIISSTALVVLFKFSLGDGGFLDILYREVLHKTYVHPLVGAPNALITILIYSVLFGIGGNIIIIGGAMNSIDPQLFESGEIDGCNWFQELIYIILPCIWPTLSTMLILSVASFLGSTGPILPFTKGAYETSTLAYYIFALVAGIGVGAKQDLYLASAIGLIMTAVSFPLALVVKRIVYGRNE